MLSNIAFFLMAPVLLIGGFIYAKRAALGRRSNRLLPLWTLIALISAFAMYAVALAPLLVFLLSQRGHPEFQGFYYSSLKWLAVGGWGATLAAVLWESIRSGPSWSAIWIVVWATGTFFSCLIATMFMVAVQV